jgi:hypothetical protein
VVVRHPAWDADGGASERQEERSLPQHRHGSVDQLDAIGLQGPRLALWQRRRCADADQRHGRPGDLVLRNPTQTFRDKFKLGAPNAQGIATLSGSGHTISGIGRAKGLKSSYVFTGTFNTKTGVYTIHLTGTYTFT